MLIIFGINELYPYLQSVFLTTYTALHKIICVQFLTNDLNWFFQYLCNDRMRFLI